MQAWRKLVAGYRHLNSWSPVVLLDFIESNLLIESLYCFKGPLLFLFMHTFELPTCCAISINRYLYILKLYMSKYPDTDLFTWTTRLWLLECYNKCNIASPLDEWRCVRCFGSCFCWFQLDRCSVSVASRWYLCNDICVWPNSSFEHLCFYQGPVLRADQNEWPSTLLSAGVWVCKTDHH